MDGMFASVVTPQDGRAALRRAGGAAGVAG